MTAQKSQGDWWIVLGRRPMKPLVFTMAVVVRHPHGNILHCSEHDCFCLAFSLLCMHLLLLGKWSNTTTIDVQCIVPPMGVLCFPSLWAQSFLM